jgi:hypothetical protein
MSTNETGREIGNGKRLWLTAGEFKASVDAYEVACREKAGLPKKPEEPRRIDREFVLDFNLKYTPKKKSPGGTDLEAKP